MRLVGVLLLIAGSLGAQSIIEHAVAAAGGSAAGIAGKQVSEGLDKVFRSVDRTVKSAESTSFKSTTKSKSPHIVELTPPPASLPPAPARSYRSASASRRYSVSRPYSQPAPRPRPVETFDGQRVSQIVAQLDLPKVTPLDIAAVKAGVRGEDLALYVGRPVARVVIPDGSRLVEILTYSSADGYLGSVRLTDGQVVDVKPAVRR